MHPSPHPSIAVIGAGAIGAVTTACLVDAGHTPTLCVRTPIDSVMVESNGDERELTVPIVSSPEQVGPVDWVLVTVKAHETAGVAPWLARLVGPGTVVAALQNGIGHAERLEPHAAGGSILPVVVYMAAQRVAPGRVVHHRGARLLVTPGAHGTPFARLFDGSEMQVEEVADLTTEMWRKMLSNVIVNPLTALTQRRVDVMGDPGMDELGSGLMEEALAVAQAEGARLGTSDADAILSRFASLGQSSGNGTSTYYDRMAGRPMEHEELNGAVVRVGRRHGIPTPYHLTILTLLRAVDRGQAARHG